GVVASMQPIHLTFDIASIDNLLADRKDRAYAIRSLAAAGAVLAFGSDTPVAPPDVFEGLRAACRRSDGHGRRLNASEALSPDAALAAYTTGAAYAIQAEGHSGMLKPGFDADIVVLNHDPLVSLDGLAVVATMKGGAFTFGPG
ncbi:MAG TPA: amidohydrolase family protein, partial [Trueperaceae bacterium]|nr:amidohydrolase family protein [Trueperaceae bacterium]